MENKPTFTSYMQNNIKFVNIFFLNPDFYELLAISEEIRF